MSRLSMSKNRGSSRPPSQSQLSGGGGGPSSPNINTNITSFAPSIDTSSPEPVAGLRNGHALLSGGAVAGGGLGASLSGGLMGNGNNNNFVSSPITSRRSFRSGAPVTLAEQIEPEDDDWEPSSDDPEMSLDEVSEAIDQWQEDLRSRGRVISGRTILSEMESSARFSAGVGTDTNHQLLFPFFFTRN
ncbi:hypothetical protein T439DRAFT_55701 [Meredithblackwellia eburnea MCA 4105]